MSSSVKRNFSWNFTLTFSGYIFPFLTYPYASRVMGVENIGICNYVDSIINYFVLFSALGIGSLGVREIARCKDDISRRSEIFSNLLTFNMTLTFLSSIVLIILTFTIPFFASYKEFLVLGLLKLIFQPLTINWFFSGIQNFRYVTLRSIFFRIISIVLLFTLVHTKDDVLWYYSLSLITEVLCAICNLTYAHKFVHFTFKKYKPFAYIVPILAFGYYSILTSLYTTFNTFYLGSVCNNIEVGYFATACKLNTIVMSAFTALTAVMVPKVAEMLNDGKKNELQFMANKIFSLLTSLALPIIILCNFCASHIILILSGSGYEGAIPAFRIIIFLVLIIGIEQIVIQQFLMASRNNKAIFVVSTVGAVVGLSLNFLLTPNFGAVGTSLSWASSEVAVMIAGLVLLKKKLGLYLPLRTLLYDSLCSIIYVIVLLPIYLWVNNAWLNCLISGVLLIITFGVINVFIRPNEFFIKLYKKHFFSATHKNLFVVS